MMNIIVIGEREEREENKTFRQTDERKNIFVISEIMLCGPMFFWNYDNIRSYCIDDVENNGKKEVLI